MFDRKFIDLIEICQYVNINTNNMKAGNKKRESIIKINKYKKKKNTQITYDDLFETYKGYTLTELMDKPSNELFMTYYENWYCNFNQK
jgi:benzoyl-CoA reductase/2-hydroxyglutaryl-CoA dehydratase subunit BcrC/BadD/HgdB